MVKPLIPIQHIFVEVQLKKENLKSVFLGDRVWVPKPVYWSLKQPGYITDGTKSTPVFLPADEEAS